MNISETWFYESNGERRGPITATELRSLAVSQEVKPSTLIWKEGLPDWVPASRVKGLFPQSSSPPPLPKQDIKPTAIDAAKSQFAELRKQFESTISPSNESVNPNGPPDGVEQDTASIRTDKLPIDRAKLLPIGLGCGSLFVIVMCCGVVGSIFSPPQKPTIRQLEAKDPSDLTYSEKERLENFKKDVWMKTFEKMADETSD